MRTSDISYRCGDKALTGYLADGAKGRPAPGVLLCHQGGGLTEHTRERARMLGELGYVAFAADPYGEVATSREQAMALLTGLTADLPLLHARVSAGLEVLRAQANVDAGRLAAIGYCFGGWTALEMARTFSDFACVVAFHPGLSDLPRTDARPVLTKVLVCAGADDPLITPASRTQLAALMTAAGADWQLNVYGGAGHSFTDRSVDAMNIPNFSYHAATDRRSWAAMRDLFNETLGEV
jgi:dienelactone hydrolase